MKRSTFSHALFHLFTSAAGAVEEVCGGVRNIYRTLQGSEEQRCSVIMAGEEINEDYPAEIHEYLSTFENSIGAVDEMLKTMMSVSRNELLQKLDPLEQAKVDLVSAYTLNSMFWVYLATQGVNPKEHPVKQELERIRVYMNRVKEITDKKKAGKLDRGAASRFVKNALWEPKPKNASKVANKGKSKN
uniref:Nuclear nucleic acid-binding protein C1D n=3 Tax=Pteropodidae TaxID=9398 RepID=A0A7J8FEA6_ROUAE|nr:C1D nuclear receptor corepressor [Rousettus aegyptiacus]